MATDDSRDRLLEAAGQEFAQHGFQHASVRRICAQAETNVSSVKYYFGNKAGLYSEVMQVAHSRMIAGETMPVMSAEDDPSQALTRWIRWFLRLLLITKKAHPWAGRIMAHEHVNPTEALDEFVARTAGPMRREVLRIVGATIGRKPSARLTGELTNAVFALCLFQVHGSEVLTRFDFPPPEAAKEIDALAEVLSRFALSGVEGFKRTAGENEP